MKERARRHSEHTHDTGTSTYESQIRIDADKSRNVLHHSINVLDKSKPPQMEIITYWGPEYRPFEDYSRLHSMLAQQPQQFRVL